MKGVVRTLAVLLILCGAGGYYAWREGWLPADMLPAGWLPASPVATATPGAPAGSGERRRGGRRGGGAGGGGDGPVAVLTAAARRADVPVTMEAVGTAQALNTVTVRSQVDGRLVELAFQEGQSVRRGDVIARIDPTIYQAQYDQAMARRAQNEAALANARLDLARFQTLVAANIGTKVQADTQRAAVAGLEAQIKADQGAIDSARAYLDYTTVRAPIDGRTGMRFVDQGNLVRAGDTSGLVTITQLQPVTVLFSLPQQNLRAVNAAAASGAVPVEALEADNRTVLDRGALTVVDSIVDTTTGTVKLKATFPNTDLQLWPGAFVNVRLTVDTLRDAVVIPTGAVQRGPNGPFVYGVVDDTVQLKPVTVTRQDEALTAIGSGLTPPERVVTTGFARLNDGDRVRVADPQPAAEPAAAPPRRTRPVEGEAAQPREPRRPRPGGPATAEGAPDMATSAVGAAPPAGEAPSGGRRREGGGAGRPDRQASPAARP